ncbi:MAG: DUF445 family protein [Planctomycetes bacterium]|nr:DUF445 family protein [Planctomycetota bacterium]
MNPMTTLLAASSNVYWFPLIGALIGYGTNYVAVRMIFRPRRAWNLGFVKLQGLLPRRKQAFAASIGAAVETHLFSQEDIARLLQRPDIHRAIEQGVDRRMQDLIDGIVEKVPMARMFLQGALVEQVRAKILELAESMMVDVGTYIEDSVDMHAMIREKIENFDLDTLERIVLDVASRELRFIELAGAVLGALVGTAQMFLVW